MVVQGRIEFIRRKVADGFDVHVAFSCLGASGKHKVKVHIGSHPDVIPVLCRGRLARTIDLLSDWCTDCVVVDRGHKQSNGDSQANFWCRPISAVEPAPLAASSSVEFGLPAQDTKKIMNGKFRVDDAKVEQESIDVEKCRLQDETREQSISNISRRVQIVENVVDAEKARADLLERLRERRKELLDYTNMQLADLDQNYATLMSFPDDATRNDALLAIDRSRNDVREFCRMRLLEMDEIEEAERKKKSGAGDVHWCMESRVKRVRLRRPAERRALPEWAASLGRRGRCSHTLLTLLDGDSLTPQS